MKKYLPFQFYKGGTESSTWHLPEDSLARIGRGYIRDIALSPDGSFLVVASDLGLWWYDVDTRSLLTFWETRTHVESVAFSNCGQWIATGGRKGSSINVWDVVNGNCLMELARMETGCNSRIVFSPDRKHIAVCGSWRYEKDYFSVEVYSLPETPQENDGPVCLESTYTYGGYFPLAFSPDSTLLAFGAPIGGAPLPFHTEGYPIHDKNRGLIASNIAVCDVKTGQHLTTLSGFNDVERCCFSPDGRFVAAGYRPGPICVWEVPEDFSPDALPWHLHKVYQEKDNENTYCVVGYSPEGVLRTVERSLDDDTLSVSDPEQGKKLYQHPNQIGHCCTDFYSAKHLAIAGDYEVHVWTLGEQHSTCVSQMHAFPAHSLNFSLDGKRLLAMHRSDGIFIWDVTLPDRPPHVFNSPAKELDSYASETYFSVIVSPDEKQLVTSGDENSIRIWELGIDTLITAFPIQEKVSDATFSPTANLIACRDASSKIYIWDVTIGELRDTYISEGEVWNTGLTFSPNGAYLACAPSHLYDVVRRKHIDKFTSENVQFQAFSPDSAYVWDTAFADETIRLWDIHQYEVVLSLRKPDPELWEGKSVETFTLSACGQYLACSLYTLEAKSRLFVWDIRKGDTPIVTFEAAPKICSLVFSSETTLLASGMEDGTILLWDMRPYLKDT